MDTIFNHPEVTSVIAGLVLFGIGAKILNYSWKSIARWYLYLAVLAVIIVMDSIFFPFIGGKDYFFRTAIELSLACFLLWWAFEAKAGELAGLLKRAYKNPVVRAVTVFAVMFLLASLFAYDIHAGFWSNYERGEGGFQMIHYYVFFLLLVLLLTEEKEWRNIFRFSLFAAVAMIGYGILGNFGVPTFIGPYSNSTMPAGFWHTLVDGRFQGSLGNAAYVAAYLLFAMFFLAYLWIRTIGEKRATVLRNAGYAVLMLIFLFFFLISETRGAFMGLVIALYAMLIYLAYNSERYRRPALALLALFIIIAGALVHLRTTHFVQAMPGGRMFDFPLSDGVLAALAVVAMAFALLIGFAKKKKALWWGVVVLALLCAVGVVGAKETGHFPSFADPTTSTRFWVWGEAWQGFLARPILGWGPENFTTVFDKYFNPNFYSPTQSTETWFDRAHSVYFDYLVETGILGLLAYLSIFVTFYWMLFKRWRQSEEGEHGRELVVERGFLLAVPLAYLIQGVAIFDVLPMYLSLFLFLGFAVYHLNGRKPTAVAHQ